MFDGWDDGTSDHIVGLYANTPKGTFFLRHGELDDATNQTGANHAAWIQDSLLKYGKSLANVAFLVSDNTNLCPSIANFLGKPLIGCASHKLNLAVKKYLKDNVEIRNVLDKIHNLMQFLKGCNPAGKLNLLTTKVAITRNNTRWLSIFQMVKRYMELSTHLTAAIWPDAVQLLLSPLEHQTVTQMIPSLEHLREVTTVLQGNDITLLDARILFDDLIGRHPGMASHLGVDANVVHIKNFV